MYFPRSPAPATAIVWRVVDIIQTAASFSQSQCTRARIKNCGNTEYTIIRNEALLLTYIRRVQSKARCIARSSNKTCRHNFPPDNMRANDMHKFALLH